MAKSKKPSGTKNGAATASSKGNDFDEAEAEQYFERLDEINERMQADAAAGRKDMNSVYDEAVSDLDVTKEALKIMWARRNAEKRFENRAKKLDATDRKSLERFASAMKGSPMGDWATQFGDLAEVEPKVKTTKQKQADA